METNLQVFNQIRKDIEKEVNQHISSILTIHNANPEEILTFLDVNKVQEKVIDKYNQLTVLEVDHPSENDELWTVLNQDFDDYDKLAQNLYNRSISTQLHTLDKLLSAYVIDTKQKSWLTLSRSLQQCLSSSNEEVFKKSLKIHYKIISTPTASSEGYLNLIQVLIFMFNTDMFHSKVINENNKIHRHTILIFKLILKTQKVILKNWLHAKQKIIEEVIITFIYLLNHHLGFQRYLGPLDFLAMLDPEATWFKYFCYGLQTRNIVLNCLKKTPNLIKYFFTTFLDYVNNSFQSNNRHFFNFSHSGYFLLEYLKYRLGISIFPVKLQEEILTLECFALIIVININNLTDCLGKRILVKLLNSLLINNYNLILHPEIQGKLFEPFSSKNIDKRQLYLKVEKNIHILEIIKKLSKTNHSNMVLSNLSDLRKTRRLKNDFFTIQTPREKNFLQLIVNLTTACIRNFVNKSEIQHHVNPVIFELIDCCESLFKLNSRTFTLVNINKLLTSLRDFYRTILNHDFNNDVYKSRISHSLCFFMENDYSALKILEGESKFLHEIVSIALSNDNLNQSKLILSIVNIDEGSNIITLHHDFLIKQGLMDIWACEIANNDTLLNLTESKLLVFLHLVSYNFKAIKALLCFENEGTIVQDQKPLVLAEVIENCLDETCSDVTCITLGLNIIKILINNIDVLLYFLSNYKLEENIRKVQINNRITCIPVDDDSASMQGTMIIDECSSLCSYIILAVEYTGIFNIFSHEKLLDGQIALEPTCNKSSSSGFRRYHKPSCELQKFLYDSRYGLRDHSWLLQARRAFKASCKDKYKISIITDLIEQIPKTSPINFLWPSPNVALHELFAEEYHGVIIIVRFGIKKCILQPSIQNEQNLILLLEQSRIFLNYDPKEFIGFDWFVGMIFLVCSGNLEKSKITLFNIANTSVASLIWPTFGKIMDVKQISEKFYRLLEIILDDTTKLNCALTSLGTSARYIAQKWLSHCFFTILDFNEICNFLMMSFLYPSEYVLFFTLAIFDHLKENIFVATNELNNSAMLKICKAMDFRICNYLNFMDKLFKTYKNILQI